MPRRKVTACSKGPGGRVVGLFGPSFGYRTAQEVIEGTLAGREHYFVREGSHETDVRVIFEKGKQTLVTTRDILSRNNLRNLPSHPTTF
jgi:hypothetical protein